MKIGIISDLHIKLFKNNTVLYPFLFKALDYFYSLCEERKIDKIFILGDMFHIKNIISSSLLSDVIDYFRNKMKNTEHIVLVGNHDRINNEDTFLKVFDNDCVIVKNYYSFKNKNSRFHFLGYAEDSLIKDILKKTVYEKNTEHFLFGHLALKGFSYDNGHEDISSDLSSEDFKNIFKRIYSGHYHSYQTKGCVTYVSSPFQSKHGETGPNGFIFLDEKKGFDRYEFINNKYAPEFKTFEFNKNNLKKIINTENSFIRIILKENLKTDLRLFSKFKEKVLNKNYDVKFIYEKEDGFSDLKNINIPVIKGWDSFIHSGADEIIIDFINNCEFNENKKKELLEFIL